MNISKQELRNMLSETIGDRYESVTTGAGSTTSEVIDSALQDESETDNIFGRNWIQMHSGLDSGNIRRVDTSTGTTGALVTTRAWDNTIQSDEVFTLHKWSPVLKDRALSRAFALSFPRVFNQIVDTSIIVDNILPNPSLDVIDIGLRFDGADDDVTVSDATAIQNMWATGATLEVHTRIFSDGSSSQGKILAKGAVWTISTVDETVDGQVAIQLFHDRATTDGIWRTYPTNIPLNVPVWISISYDSGAAGNVPQVCVNGVPLDVYATSSGSGAATTDVGSALTIGYDGTNDWFDGVIYEMRMWDYVRSQSQIARNLNTKYQGTEDGFIFLFRCDLGTGSTLYDSSPNDLTGTITSATWTQDVEGWKNYNGATTLADSNTIFGDHSIRITGVGSAGGIQRNIIHELPFDSMKGNPITFRGWVWSTTASSARLSLGLASTYTSDYHDGTDEWQLLEVSQAYESGVSAVTLSTESAVGASDYIALLHAYTSPIDTYVLPKKFQSPPKKVLIQADEKRPGTGEYVSIDQGVITGRVLKIIGVEPFSMPQTDTESIAINPQQVSALIAKAKEEFYKILLGREVSDSERDRYIDEQNAARQEYDELEANLPLAIASEHGQRWSTYKEGDHYVLQLRRGALA